MLQSMGSQKAGHDLATEQGLPCGSEVKVSACNAGDPGLIPGLIPGLEDTLEKEMATYSSILAWRIQWTEEPSGHGVTKSWTRLSDFTFTLTLATEQ